MLIGDIGPRMPISQWGMHLRVLSDPEIWVLAAYLVHDLEGQHLEAQHCVKCAWFAASQVSPAETSAALRALVFSDWGMA